MDLKNDAFIFGLGLVVGIIPTYFITKHFCEIEKEEEIESVKERYSKKDWEEIKRDMKKSQEEKTEKTMTIFKNILRNEGYVAKPKVAVTEPSENKMTHIKAITENEFGEDPEYDIVNLYYNKDTNTLLDESGEIVDKPSDYIGPYKLEGFPDDMNSILFRNDIEKIYYEVIRESKVKTHSDE